MIFERTEVSKYRFTGEKSELQDIVSKNMENKFFLATATTWNYEKTKPVYEYLTNSIFFIENYEGLKPYAFEHYYYDKDDELKKFSLKILNEAEMNIDGYAVTDVELTAEQRLAIPSELREFFPVGAKGFSVTTSHNIKDEQGNSKSIQLDLEEESLGTQNLFVLNPALMHVLKNGQILVIDELDKSLHPFLVKYIVKLFNSEEYNKKGAQLIFNTHDTNLLDLSIFRRDQIWFTEKDYRKGATDLYSLVEFSVRKTENIQKGYLNGRYGAIPFIAIGEEIWDDN